MSKTHDPSIKYSRLSGLEIRILILKPGLADDPLTIELECVDLARYDKQSDYESEAYNLLPPQRIRTGPVPAPLPTQTPLDVPNEDLPSFEAVSYVWGEPNFCRDLWTLAGEKVSITESLFEALVRLRYRDKLRRLWTDAVCINQQDSSERSSQVAMMGRIYKSCAKVQICLDIHSSPDLLTTSERTLVFAALNHCDSIYQDASTNSKTKLNIITELTEAFRKQPYCRCCSREVGSEYLVARIAEQGLRLACALMGHAWFTRVWVVQEVALAATAELKYGEHSVSWQAFQETMSRLPRLSLTDAVPTGISFIVMQRVNDLQTLNLYRLSYSRDIFKPDELIVSLATLKNRNCRDARDRIYALRALHGLESEGLLKPNYECPDFTVYRDTVLLCLSRMGHAWDQLPRVTVLLVLSSTQNIEAPPPGSKLMPSWVPDLGNLGSHNGIADNAVQKIEAYQSPFSHQFRNLYRDLLFQFRHQWSDSKPDVLTVQGRCVGIVKEKLLGALPNRMSWSQMSVHMRKRYCRDLVKSITSLRSLVVAANPSLPAHSIDITVQELLCCGDYGTGGDKGGIDVEDFARFLDEYGGDIHDATASVSMINDLDLARWWWILRLFLSEKPRPFDFKRSLYRVETTNRAREEVDQIKPSTSARYGWLPSNACPGDSMLYIAGAPFLFIRHESGLLNGRLAGDAWIQGIDEHEILRPNDILDWIDLS